MTRRKNGMKLTGFALDAVKETEKRTKGIERGKLSFEKATEIFLDYCDLKGLRPQTLQFYEKELLAIKRHLIELNIVIEDLTELQTDHIYEVIRIMKRKYKVSTINIRLVAMKAFLNWAVERGYIYESPAKNIKRLRDRHQVGATFSKQQLRKLLNAPDIHTFPGFRDLCIMTMLADTGARVGELIAIKLADVDLNEDAVLLRDTKNGLPRRIPLTKRLRKLLRIWIKDVRGVSDTDALFITVDGNAISRRTVQALVKHYAIQSGVENEVQASPHAFRRTFAKNKITAGVNVFTVQQYMGHASLDTLKRYVALYTPDLRDSIEEGVE